MNKELVFIYEHEQVDAVHAYTRTHPDTKVIAFDFWAQRALTERGIDTEPLGTYVVAFENMDDLLHRAQRLAHTWYRQPDSFFRHEGVELGEAHEPAVDSYLQQALYYLHVFQRVLNAHPECRHVALPHTMRPVPPTAGPLMLFEQNIVADVAKFLAQKAGLEIAEISVSRATSGAEPFPIQSSSKKWALRALNVFISIAPRRPIKIFASEYWWHIAPFIEKMDDVEIVLMDRSELWKIPWRQIWRHRMRFLHPLDMQNARIRQTARAARDLFELKWDTAKESVSKMPEFTFKEIEWWPVVMKGFDFLVTEYSERVVCDIEAIKGILKAEHINRVLLRASMSLHQHHFYVAAHIAKKSGIPSIELQHAGVRVDALSSNSRLEASYLAAYGPRTRDIHVENHHIAPDRVRPIGSPRFDRYLEKKYIHTNREERLRDMGLDSSRPIMFVSVPAEVVTLEPGHFNSYEIAAFFESLKILKDEIPSLQFIFKFRAHYTNPARRAFVHDLFPSDAVICEYEDLFELLLLCDFASSPNSTVIYEIMMTKRPLILFPWKRSDEHLTLYREAADTAFTHEELRDIVNRIVGGKQQGEELLERQDTFLRNNYSFDGHASERMEAFLRENLKP